MIGQVIAMALVTLARTGLGTRHQNPFLRDLAVNVRFLITVPILIL